MNTPHRRERGTRCLALAAALLLPALSLPALAGTRPFSAQKPADPTGTVEVVNVEGSIEISGWDQPTVEVTGTIGDKVERVDVTSAPNRTTVRVVLPSGNADCGHEECDARLKIRVPQKSALEVSLVSADLRIGGVSGNQRLQTVSGDIYGDGASGDLQVNTVSGDVHMMANHGRNAQLKTVSGDLNISGTGGDVQLNSVSGDANLKLDSVTRVHLETVSGDVNVTTSALGANGQLDADSVSGDVNLHIAAVPDADIDVQSFSGDIRNCFGPKPVEEQYGPGSRLSFRSGKGGGRIHVDTKSGDVTICTSK